MMCFSLFILVRFHSASWWVVFYLVFPGVGFRLQSRGLCVFMAPLGVLEARKRAGWVRRGSFSVVLVVFSRQVSFRLVVGCVLPCFPWCRFSCAIQGSLSLHGAPGGSGSSETRWLGPEGLVSCGFRCFFSPGFIRGTLVTCQQTRSILRPCPSAPGAHEVRSWCTPGAHLERSRFAHHNCARSWCTPGAHQVHTWSAPGALQVCPQKS